MQPIQVILNRIRWDPEFMGDFVIGYHDRIADEIVHVSMSRIDLSLSDRFVFEFRDEEGTSHSVPYHRIREVFRDGKLIWHRNREDPE